MQGIDRDRLVCEVTTQGVPFKNAGALAIGKSGRIWVGMIDGGPGLGLQHLAHGTWVKDIFEDHEGDIWVVTSGGIDEFHALPVVTFSSRQGLSVDSAEAVSASPSGAIWVSDATALARFRHGKVTAYGRRDGLPGNGPTALFEDAYVRLWGGVDNGVAVFDHGHFTRARSNVRQIGPIFEFTAGPGQTVWGISATAPSSLVRMSEMRALEFIPAPAGTRFTTLAPGPAKPSRIGCAKSGRHRAGARTRRTFFHGRPGSKARKSFCSLRDGCARTTVRMCDKDHYMPTSNAGGGTGSTVSNRKHVTGRTIRRYATWQSLPGERSALQPLHKKSMNLNSSPSAIATTEPSAPARMRRDGAARRRLPPKKNRYA